MAYRAKFRKNPRGVVRRTGRRKTKSYGKKKSYSRKGKSKTFGSSPKTTEAAKQLAVYVNPFSVATQQPKIPDGARNHSLGVSYRYSTALTLTDVLPACYVALVPGLTTTLIYRAIESTDNAWPFINVGADEIVYHTKPQSWGHVFATDGNRVEPFYSNPSVEAWRCVSQGLKIRTTNNALTDQGFWQAIRFRHCNVPSKIRVRMDGTGTGYFPMWENKVPVVAEWPNDPSYMSGTLRQLSSKSFMLATEDNKHKFISMPTTGEHQEIVQYDQLYDTSFDTILIKITGAENTNLLFESFSNQESTWNAASELNAYQTQTAQVAPATLTQVFNKKKYLTKKVC